MKAGAEQRKEGNSECQLVGGLVVGAGQEEGDNRSYSPRCRDKKKNAKTTIMRINGKKKKRAVHGHREGDVRKGATASGSERKSVKT